jgi:hypothetical protein
MKLQEIVAQMLPKQPLQKVGELIAAMVRALHLPPEQPMKRRPF